ncbi:MAG: hypothetical protein IH788_06050 [Nitrospinae bacterium]|nr:hypothetical protein [Nitrospinota bacterium]
MIDAVRQFPAERLQQVLLVDIDPQAHATLALGLDPDEVVKGFLESTS